jgi:DNA-binding response OmpR family regulator
MRVLVVEDEPEIARTIARALEEIGLAADVAPDGREGLRLARGGGYAAMILDLLLPHVPGLSVLKTLREEGVQVPILILTAVDGVDERIQGLDLGADDYLAKPFALGELLARVRALLRRGSPGVRAAVVKLGDLEVDLTARTVRRRSLPVRLSRREFALLVHFLNHRGAVVSRQEIGQAVVDRVFEPRSNLLDVAIHELRAKLGTPELIHTVRGVGYRFDVDGEGAP